jgi:hypothetical protein
MESLAQGPAADVQDRDGALHLLRRARRLFPFSAQVGAAPAKGLAAFAPADLRRSGRSRAREHQGIAVHGNVGTGDARAVARREAKPRGKAAASGTFRTLIIRSGAGEIAFDLHKLLTVPMGGGYLHFSCRFVAFRQNNSPHVVAERAVSFRWRLVRLKIKASGAHARIEVSTCRPIPIALLIIHFFDCLHFARAELPSGICSERRNREHEDRNYYRGHLSHCRFPFLEPRRVRRHSSANQ